MQNFEHSLNFSPGYVVLPSFDNEDLQVAIEFIQSQWISRIRECYPIVYSLIDKYNYTIQDYHLITQQLDHASLWPKHVRILGTDFEEWFTHTSFFKELQSLTNGFSVSDEERLGRANFYWRIVRPNEEGDIGPVHCDSWFWLTNNDYGFDMSGKKRTKVWVPLSCECSKNTLLLEPDSHTRSDVSWRVEQRHGSLKPVLQSTIKPINLIMPPVGTHQCLVFNDNLLHSGSLNRGHRCRISFEFTMISSSQYD